MFEKSISYTEAMTSMHPGVMQARQVSHQEAGPHEHEERGASAEARGLLQAVTGGFAQELAALREGMAYICAPKNRCKPDILVALHH